MRETYGEPYCPTCLKIEAQSRAAVESGFAGELAAGTVRFRIVNFDRPENKHFIDDYGLAFKTVVISGLSGGKELQWTKYDRVWDLVGSPDEFRRYLQEGIHSRLRSDDDA